jgi:ribosomal protein S18 acetylase RimI-like enzyme
VAIVPETDPAKAPAGATAVEAVGELTDEVVASLAHLVPQVSSAGPPSKSWLAEMLANPGTTLLVARGEQGAIVGTLTLSVTRLLTGVRAFVEDVVVDAPARGQGVGTALVREALRRAALAGARTVDLTSRPEREAANGLYASLGFQRRDTNVYRYTL